MSLCLEERKINLVIFLEKCLALNQFEINYPNFLYIFLLDVNFENLPVILYVLIISFMLAKFQEDQIQIVILSIKIFKFQIFVV